ncbi:MAG: MOSC N-terminal beta barrel domain-containing protein [Xanthomonadaceae bacterium]|nr:MOSC N-terminal beta barrel domain-containing protein [Xanthomonadaceae bacterium]
MTATLASIHVYPLKSCAPMALDSARVEARGLEHDRRWMAVDASGKFLTGRQHPRLTLIRAEPDDAGALRLRAPDMPELRLMPAPDRARSTADVWGSRVDALVADAAADAWISAFLGIPARFVHMDADCLRNVDPDYAQPGDSVSFADGYPLLAISQAALDLLNSKLAQPVPMLRFRPNLVIAGTTPHAEDNWQCLRIGGVQFDVVKPCIRCVFTTVDFARGAFDESGEPLRTLLTYRRTATGVSFGQNLIPRGAGTLRIGDTLEPLA